MAARRLNSAASGLSCMSADCAELDAVRAGPSLGKPQPFWGGRVPDAVPCKLPDGCGEARQQVGLSAHCRLSGQCVFELDVDSCVGTHRNTEQINGY